MSYAVAQLDAIEETAYNGCLLRPVRHHLGITAFGVNAWTVHAAGDRIMPEHEEDSGHEELYVVLRGRAVFDLDGERRDAPAGTLVFVRAGVKRTAFAEDAHTAVLALGGRPGEAYRASGWELWGQVWPLYEAGEYAQAADRARELTDANPQYATMLYNLACCESLAGRPADALEHLRHAIEMSEDLRGLATSDSDFDLIRGEPAFAELVGRA